MSAWKTTVVKVPIGHFSVYDADMKMHTILSIRMDRIESYQELSDRRTVVRMMSGMDHYLEMSHARFKEHYDTAMQADLS